MLRVVINLLAGLHHARRRLNRLPGIQVAIEARKVAAGDIQADAMAGLEHVAGGPQIDVVADDFAWRDWLGSLSRVAIAGAHDAVGEETRVSGGIDIRQQRSEIRIHGRACRMNFSANPSGYFGVFFQRRRGEYQHVGTAFVGTLIRWTGRNLSATA